MLKQQQREFPNAYASAVAHLYVPRFTEYSEHSDDRLNTTNLFVLFTYKIPARNI
jgi:hypothetical protein